MITAKDIKNGRILYETARHTSREAFEKKLTNKSRPRISDVLITKDGSIGRVAITDNENICINQSVALLRPNTLIRPKFLKYLLETPSYQRQINIDADGATIKHICITRLDEMKVAIPCISEQDAILEIRNIDNKSSFCGSRIEP
jgi:type I restriction enzyme S subunit